jgi:membrane associated rhomboid family serine protease
MVFPLYDDNPLKLPVPPLATWGLIALNVLIFLVQVSAGGPAEQAMAASFGVTPAVLVRDVPSAGALPPEVTLVTSMFLHGGWDHLLGNMIYLFVFGDDIEEALGWWRFLAFYLLCGILAALGFVALHPHSTTPLIGASGAISGVLAAYLMLRPCAKVTVFVLRAVVRVQAFWVIGGWILLQLYYIGTHEDDGVAYTAHLGGLVVGAGLFWLMRPRNVQLFECIEQPADEGEAPASS